MAQSFDDPEILRLATKYVWWTAPEAVVLDGMPRLIASVMELGTWDDANDLIEIVGTDMFLAVLKSPPPGVLSDRSLAFWHCRLGGEGLPPVARRRFN